MHTSDKATLTVFLFKWGSNINCSAKQAGNSAVDSGVSNDPPKGIPCADNNRTAFEDWEEIFNYFSHTKNMHRISIYVYIYIYICIDVTTLSFFLSSCTSLWTCSTKCVKLCWPLLLSMQLKSHERATSILDSQEAHRALLLGQTFRKLSHFQVWQEKRCHH